MNRTRVRLEIHSYWQEAALLQTCYWKKRKNQTRLGRRGSAPNRRCIGGKSDSSDSEQYITASTILPFLLKEPDLLSHEEPSPGVVPKSMPLERSSSRRA